MRDIISAVVAADPRLAPHLRCLRTRDDDDDDEKPVHKGGGWHCLFHRYCGCFCGEVDKGIQCRAFFCGSYFVDFNWTDKGLFFFAFSPVQCHQIDVVSGCGKNAEGAVQTLSLVFHNLSQKHLTPAPPKLFTLNSHSWAGMRCAVCR